MPILYVLKYMEMNNEIWQGKGIVRLKNWSNIFVSTSCLHDFLFPEGMRENEVKKVKHLEMHHILPG